MYKHLKESTDIHNNKDLKRNKNFFNLGINISDNQPIYIITMM